MCVRVCLAEASVGLIGGCVQVAARVRLGGEGVRAAFFVQRRRPIRPQGVWPFAIYARPASPTAVRVVGSGLRLPAWRAWAARGPAAASYMYI